GTRGNGRGECGGGRIAQRVIDLAPHLLFPPHADMRRPACVDGRAHSARSRSCFLQCAIRSSRVWQAPKFAQKLAKYESRPAPTGSAHARVEGTHKPARIAKFATLV